MFIFIILIDFIMIDAIDLKNLRNAEYLQLTKDFCTIVSANDPAVLQVVPQHAALVTKTTELEVLFKTATANPITKELVEIDEQRDQDINGITAVAKGYIYCFDATISNAAKLIVENLGLYGSGIAVLNFQAETATLNSIVNDWETKPELVAALTTLNLISWRDHLKTVNNNFNTKYIERTQEYGAASPETIKLKREETNAVYYQLRSFIDAFSVVNSSVAAYATTINELNALIAQYNTLLSKRQSTILPNSPSA